eukprot:gene26286-31753_t
MKGIKTFFTPVSKKSASEADDAGGPSKKAKLTHGDAVADSKGGEASGNDAIAITASTSLPATNPTACSSDVPPVNWAPMDTMEVTWRQRLVKEYRKPYFQRLVQFLATETRTHTIYPPSHQIFTALNLCPYDQVKVVIIGQDPYHGPNQAHGLAFSVQHGIPPPPSLKNIFSELEADLGIPKPKHGNLEHWGRQGVVLLNTVLTVRQGDANSHQKKGWEEFTDAIVKELSQREGLVYLLWGKPAQAKCMGINHSKNAVFTSSHPSPLGAYKTNEPFMGSKIFSRCNAALQRLGKEPIDWNIPN